MSADPRDDWHLRPVPDDPDDDPGTVGGPPCDLDAERALLGAALLDPGNTLDLIDPEDLYRPTHETLWHACAKAHADGAPDLPMAVVDHLRAHGQLLRVGGAAYLHDCIAACTTPRAAPQYAERVRTTAHLRRIQQVGNRLQQLATTGDPDRAHEALIDASLALEEAVAGFGDRANGHTATGLRDLAWLLTGQAPHVPGPEWCRRSDGTALFYAARTNGVYGDPEAAKSWLAQVAIVEALNAGQRAALIDVDHNGEQLTTERLLLLGARPEQLADPERFRYLEPDDADELYAAIDSLVAWHPAVAVLDSIGEILPMVGAGTSKNDEITVALRRLAKPLADAGACVITIDHLPKDPEARNSGYSIGGTAKKRAMDGAYLSAEVRLPPAPGQLGKVTLRIEKDRPGRLRATCHGKYAGTFLLDSRIPDITTATVECETEMPRDDQGQARPTILMEKVSRFVEGIPGATTKTVSEAKLGKAEYVRKALHALVLEGYLRVQAGERNAAHHFVVRPYRREEDEDA